MFGDTGGAGGGPRGGAVEVGAIGAGGLTAGEFIPKGILGEVIGHLAGGSEGGCVRIKHHRNIPERIITISIVRGRGRCRRIRRIVGVDPFAH